jgi:CheY-like chemotaxis protein
LNEAQKQNRILFVDDDAVFLGTIADLFAAWSNDKWHIRQATSADQALDLLRKEKMDVIVVDANMPVLDGIQFLKILTRRHPELKKVMLTGLATEEKRSACLANGAELFIEKPRSSDGLKAVFAMLDELMTWKPREGFQGMLRKVGLQDVIQMECLGRNSCVLEISNQQLSGRLYIEEGSLIHAILGNLNGEKALQKLLSLAGGSFQLLPFEQPAQRTVSGPWEFLLMEAARVRDESVQVPDQDPATGAAPGAGDATHVTVVETLVSSESGNVLYEWQCPDAGTRLAWLQKVAQAAADMASESPLGTFDRLEINAGLGRAVAQARADRLIFVRVTHRPETS